MSIRADTALGTAPGTPTTNITFAGDGTLQWAGDFALSASRWIQIDAGCTATIDMQSYNDPIQGHINGGGGLTKIGTGRLDLSSADASGLLGNLTVLDGVIAAAGSGSLGSGGSALIFDGGALQATDRPEAWPR